MIRLKWNAIIYFFDLGFVYNEYVFVYIYNTWTKINNCWIATTTDRFANFVENGWKS